ncbi:MAG TPA: PIN domain-containing protein, partial [Acidobacteriota bacterium]|nr:PIN domain-containing protein [Acidobacteriota bacterium]
VEQGAPPYGAQGAAGDRYRWGGETMAKKQPELLFIDTNILLDFYRARSDAGVTLLEKLDALHPQIITTYQVEMEFKKNRQKVILEGLNLLKPSDTPITPPAFVADAKTVEVMKRYASDTKKRLNQLKDRIKRIYKTPALHDPVYKVTQRLFSNHTELNLHRDHLYRRNAKRLALRRFLLGYPPRKKDDTSAGDAFNWEWMVKCVNDKNRDLIIVSRDADYGITVDGVSYPNDALAQELKERANQQRKITLCDRLSLALRVLKVEVTDAEAAQDDAIAQEVEAEQMSKEKSPTTASTTTNEPAAGGSI